MIIKTNEVLPTILDTLRNLFKIGSKNNINFQKERDNFLKFCQDSINPNIVWEYKLGNRSALEWIFNQDKEKKPKDKTIAEKFNNYSFFDDKETVIDLLTRVTTVSIKTIEIVKLLQEVCEEEN